MKLGDDGLVKGGQSRAELFSRTKDGKILLYPRVDSNSNCTFLGISSFFYCEFVRQSVQFKHISFFSRASRIEKSAAFPNATCLEKAREQFFIPKDRRKRSPVNCPPEGED